LEISKIYLSFVFRILEVFCPDFLWIVNSPAKDIIFSSTQQFCSPNFLPNIPIRRSKDYKALSISNASKQFHTKEKLITLTLLVPCSIAE